MEDHQSLLIAAEADPDVVDDPDRAAAEEEDEEDQVDKVAAGEVAGVAAEATSRHSLATTVEEERRPMDATNAEARGTGQDSVPRPTTVTSGGLRLHPPGLARWRSMRPARQGVLTTPSCRKTTKASPFGTATSTTTTTTANSRNSQKY